MADVVLHGADLDLLELALQPGGPVLVAAAAVFTDPERTPLAELHADGRLSALRPFAPRPELDVEHVMPLTAPAIAAAAAAVVFDALPTRAQLAAVDALDGGAVAWVALTGRDRVGTPAGALLGAVQAAALAWAARTGRAAPVTALPWSLDARPAVLPLPANLAVADRFASWITGLLRVPEALVFGAGDEHRVLARLEGDADAAARALYPAEVLPFHRGERGGGRVVLLTGLSGSGKSTIAQAVAARLTASGSVVSVLDGDEVRQLLSAGLGFDVESRALNIRRIGWVATEIARAGGVAIAAPIAPFEAGRAEMRQRAEAAGVRFVLVHVSTPLEACEARDRKGLYAAARAGRIADFTGISSPYETPSDPDATIDTTRATLADSVSAVLALLDERNPQ